MIYLSLFVSICLVVQTASLFSWPFNSHSPRNFRPRSFSQFSRPEMSRENSFVCCLSYYFGSRAASQVSHGPWREYGHIRKYVAMPKKAFLPDARWLVRRKWVRPSMSIDCSEAPSNCLCICFYDNMNWGTYNGDSFSNQQLRIIAGKEKAKGQKMSFTKVLLFFAVTWSKFLIWESDEGKFSSDRDRLIRPQLAKRMLIFF